MLHFVSNSALLRDPAGDFLSLAVAIPGRAVRLNRPSFGADPNWLVKHFVDGLLLPHLADR